MVGIFALRLQEMAIGLYFCESRKYNIVGQKVRVGHSLNIGNTQRIAPDCILTDVWFPRRHNDFGCESQLFALLIEPIIAVHILQRIDAIIAFCDTFYNETPAAVGSRNTQHRFVLEGSVALIAVKSYQNAFYRL